MIIMKAVRSYVADNMKIVVILFSCLFILTLSSCEPANDEQKKSETVDKEQALIGSWESKSGGVLTSLELYSSGSFILDGLGGPEFGRWSGNADRFELYEEGIRIGRGYLYGNYQLMSVSFGNGATLNFKKR